MDKELIQYIDATDNMQLEYLESKKVIRIEKIDD